MTEYYGPSPHPASFVFSWLLASSCFGTSCRVRRISSSWLTVGGLEWKYYLSFTKKTVMPQRPFWLAREERVRESGPQPHFRTASIGPELTNKV